MYNWQLEILTDWERNQALNFTHPQYRALFPIEKIEVKIAFAKVAVNIAIEKLRAAFDALPWPPHEVQIWCKKINTEFGMLFDNILSARKVNPDLRQIWIEDHTEYETYGDVVNEYRGRQVALRMYRNKHERITAAVLQKKRKKTANSEL